jgi:cobalt/nickel transport protein
MRVVISILSVVFLTAMMAVTSPALAHFGTITPSDDIVTQDDSKTLKLQIKFIHPM